jgi:hypothetical protein
VCNVGEAEMVEENAPVRLESAAIGGEQTVQPLEHHVRV